MQGTVRSRIGIINIRGDSMVDNSHITAFFLGAGYIVVLMYILG